MKLNFKQLPFFPVLAVIVFFILGGVVGGMFVKIQYLENSNKVVPVAAPTAPTAGQQPTAPTTVNVKVDAADPVLGNPNAKVTVVEFADYQCPYCEKFYTDTFSQIKKDYVDTGKIKFVFKNLAFLGKESTDAANAAMCAKEQNKFWEYHDKLFTSQSGENQGGFGPDKLKGLAVALGLNTTQFNTCLDTQKYNSQVTADAAEANRNGFQSTPSTAVGSTPIVGAQPYAQFKAAIDAQLAK